MMSFEIKWLVKQRVIWGNTGANFQVEELFQLNELMLEYLAEATPGRLIHFIGDMRQVTVTPSLRDQRQLTFPTHPQFGWTVMYGLNTNPVAKMVMSIVTQLFRVRFREVADFEAALDFLQYVDITLPDLAPYRSNAFHS
jgi:hypothetical protein